MNMQNDGSIEPESPPREWEDVIFASKHRPAILDSAKIIIDVRRQTPQKRKATLRESTTHERRKKIAVSTSNPQSGTRSSNNDVVARRLPLNDKEPNIRSYLAPSKQSLKNSHTSLSKLVDTFTEAKNTSASCVTQDLLSNDSNQISPKPGVVTGRIVASHRQGLIQHTSNAHSLDNSVNTMSNELKSDMILPLFPPISCLSDVEFSDVCTTTSAVGSSSQSSSSIISDGMRPFLRKSSHDTTSLDGQNSLPSILPALRIATCFRIAEVSRHLKDQDFLVELYAIAIPIDDPGSSETQKYKLADLFFPNRPPYLAGSYNVAPNTGSNVSREATISTSANTAFTDKKSKVLIPSSQSTSRDECELLVRTIIRPLNPAKVKPPLRTESHNNVSRSVIDQSGVIAHVHIEAIWKSTWEEVSYVRGIVDPDGIAAEGTT